MAASIDDVAMRLGPSQGHENAFFISAEAVATARSVGRDGVEGKPPGDTGVAGDFPRPGLGLCPSVIAAFRRSS